MKNLLACLLIFYLLCIFTSCTVTSVNENKTEMVADETETSDKYIENPNQEESQHDEQYGFFNDMPNPYKAVLENRAKLFFINESNNTYKDIKLNDCLYSNSDVFPPQIIFAVVDLDGDEIIVKKAYDNGDGSGVVLHYEDGTVYGYSFGAGEIKELKTDGSYYWTGGGDYKGYFKTQFFGVLQKYLFLANYQSDGGNYKYGECFIDNLPVTEVELDAFCEAQNQKENVNWYELNEDTISSLVEIK